MKRVVLVLLAMLFFVNFAAADVIFTEVMYAPTQTESDTDGEWVEVYNNGDESVDLTDWKLDGYNFEDFVLESGDYLVIARELYDGDDADNESFESVYGLEMNVVDGYFALSDESDTLELSNGNETVPFSYTSSIGAYRNGLSLTRINLSLDEWEEREPTPGQGVLPVGDVELVCDVSNALPVVENITLLIDDSSDEGVQVLPNLEGKKFFDVAVEVSDANGFDDVEKVVAEVAGRRFNLSFISNSSLEKALYQGTVYLDNTDPSGFYDLVVEARDMNVSYGETNFTFLGFISTTIDTSSLSFSNLEPGSLSDEEYLVVRNTGNVNVQTLLAGTDLVSGESKIPIENVEVLVDEWTMLSSVTQDICTLSPGFEEQIPLRIHVPSTLKSGRYVGALQITSLEG